MTEIVRELEAERDLNREQIENHGIKGNNERFREVQKCVQHLYDINTDVPISFRLDRSIQKLDGYEKTKMGLGVDGE